MRQRRDAYRRLLSLSRGELSSSLPVFNRSFFFLELLDTFRSACTLLISPLLDLQTNQKSLEEISALFGETVEHDPLSEDGQKLSIFEDRGDKASVDIKVNRSHASDRSD